MLSLTYILIFVFCLAIAIAGIWIGHQFTTTYNTKFHRSYFYYLVTFYGFAFYGIWAQILMRTLLSSKDMGGETIEMVANFLPILGLPFLFISWIMLVNIGYSMVDVKPKHNPIRIHLIFLAIAIATVWGVSAALDKDHWLLGQSLVYTEIGLVLGIELIYMIFFASIVLHYSKKYKKPYKKIINGFVLLMLLGLALRVAVLLFHDIGPWIFAPLLLLYFLSNFVPLFFLKLRSDLIFTPVYAEHPNEGKKALLFRKYRITKREKEIVDKICQGKTNQQIANELFISLQTVKDHTHRIYTKIGINSRLKLVQMING